jgi:hypothetical protein
MKILYLGDDYPHSTSGHRAAALRRLGHEVVALNPRMIIPWPRIVGGISTRFGLWPFAPLIYATLRSKIGKSSFDLAWVDGGSELAPGFHRWLRHRGMKIVNYNVDDPFGDRDGRKWDLYRAALPYHDLTVVVRNENVEEARSLGARKVLHVFRSYDPVAHAPLVMNEEVRRRWASEVVFVGSWMPERGPFMARLLELGVLLTIIGDHWPKAVEWDRLKGAVRGQAAYGADYVHAIQASKVALGLLSIGNRDLHTQRSAEIPFIGGAVFCAQRTTEHEAMFHHHEQAVLWSTADECAIACHELLADETLRGAIAKNARRRIEELGLSNDRICSGVLDRVAAPVKGHASLCEFPLFTGKATECV